MNKKIFLFLKITLTILFTTAFYFSFSQGRTGYLAGTGVIYYNGDLNEKSDKIISPSKVFKPFFRIGLNYRLTNRIESSLSFFYGNIAGADSLARENDNKLRNQSFKSVIEEISLQFEYHLFGVYRKRLLNPYIFAGAGVFHFNPTTEYEGVVYDLQPIGTEGQYIGSGAYPKPYKLIQVSLPVGIGLYFQLNDHWRLKIDYANHFTFTDYLDDVSTRYPDSTILANSPHGALAVALSSKRLDGYPFPNRSRGNPQYKDSYSHIGITVIYNPGELSTGRGYGSQKNSYGKKGGRKKKKNSCPAYD